MIADHLRTLSFAIADGIQPGNTERAITSCAASCAGRCVMGARSAFQGTVLSTNSCPRSSRRWEACSRNWPSTQEKVAATIKTEEESFNRTLDRGIALFEEAAAELPAGGQVSGAVAFRLSDEQGFPLDLTEVMARERGLTVDTAGFATNSSKNSAPSPAPRKRKRSSLPRPTRKRTMVKTDFVGYVRDTCIANIEEVQRGRRTGLRGRQPFAVLRRDGWSGRRHGVRAGQRQTRRG